MNYSSFSNKTIFYTLLALALLATGLILWFDYAVIITKIITTNDQVVRTRQEIEQLKNKITYLATMQQELDQAKIEKQNLAQINLFTDGLSVINFLERIANASHVSIVFKVQGDKQPVFDIEALGDFDGVLRFLKRLAVAPGSVGLQEVSNDIGKDKTQVKVLARLIPSFLPTTAKKP